MWKKAVVAYFKVLSRYYRAGTENKQWETSVRIAGVPDKIRTGYLFNIRQKHYRLSQLHYFCPKSQ
jgi:hypothetical protein